MVLGGFFPLEAIHHLSIRLSICSAGNKNKAEWSDTLCRKEERREKCLFSYPIKHPSEKQTNRQGKHSSAFH